MGISAPGITCWGRRAATPALTWGAPRVWTAAPSSRAGGGQGQRAGRGEGVGPECQPCWQNAGLHGGCAAPHTGALGPCIEKGGGRGKRGTVCQHAGRRRSFSRVPARAYPARMCQGLVGTRGCCAAPAHGFVVGTAEHRPLVGTGVRSCPTRHAHGRCAEGWPHVQFPWDRSSVLCPVRCVLSAGRRINPYQVFRVQGSSLPQVSSVSNADGLSPELAQSDSRE